MCAVCPLARHGTTQPAASGPGWRSPSAPAAAAQYGGGPVVLEPATSLNTIATTMEHGSARPGFVGVHIGAGQHSEVSNDVNENLAINLMLILSKPSSPTSFLPLSLVGRALHNPPWLRPLQWRRMEAFLNQTSCVKVVNSIL